MTVWFKVDFHSGKPVYEQIKNGVKDLIANSILKYGDPLPSVREFSRILGVNVNTVVRAYRELELEKIIVSRKGVGFFVNVDEDRIKERLTEDLKEKLVDPLMKLRRIGLTDEEIMKIVHDLLSKLSEVED